MASRSQAHVALGRAIKELRVQEGLSQEALADLSDMHRTYVGAVERGEKNVGFANLLKLSRALQVQPSEVLLRAERHPFD